MFQLALLENIILVLQASKLREQWTILHDKILLSGAPDHGILPLAHSVLEHSMHGCRYRNNPAVVTGLMQTNLFSSPGGTSAYHILERLIVSGLCTLHANDPSFLFSNRKQVLFL